MKLLKTRQGATGSGYALSVGLISIVALGAVTAAGGSVTNLFGGVGDTLIEVAAADLSISPGAASSMDITSGPAPAYSATVTFAIKNIGNSPTAELSSSLTNSTDFVIDSDGCSGLKLQSQSTCTVGVSAVAVANGSYAGSLRVGGGAKFVEATLAGTASGLDPAAMSVDQPSVTGMNVAGPGSPATGTPVTLTFTNDGEVTTGSLSTSNDNATNFAIASDTCNGATLAGGASCSMQVTPHASEGSGTVVANIAVGDGVTSATANLSGTISGFSLFTFTSHTFTSCGENAGRTGPTLSQCRSAYSTPWDEDNANFAQGTYQGFQLWTVPETGSYRITAVGAAGGQGNTQSRGYGASMAGTFSLNEGDKLTIVVGQQGFNTNSTNGGGGGGSFVWNGTRGSTPLIAAGGGGGGGYNSAAGHHAVTGTTGTYPTNCGYTAGSGGQGGAGWTQAGGGAGFNSSGTASGFGGDNNTFVGGYYDGTSVGGFGGGGSGAPGDNGGGGGGGYSGGGAGCDGGNGYGGGGGASYNGGSNQSNSGGANSGPGSVTIQKL